MTAAVLDSGVMGCATLRMLGVANASRAARRFDARRNQVVSMIQNELLDDFTRSWWGWLVITLAKATVIMFQVILARAVAAPLLLVLGTPSNWAEVALRTLIGTPLVAAGIGSSLFVRFSASTTHSRLGKSNMKPELQQHTGLPPAFSVHFTEFFLVHPRTGP